MKFLADFSKVERILSVVSAIWLLIVFVFAFDESGGDFDEEFFALFLIGGFVPVLVIVGWKWIHSAPK